MFCLLNCSIDKVSRITSVVLVIHGTDDEVIDFSHGQMIYQRCPRTVEPLWVDGAGHNDIELHEQYLERLIRFIDIELPISWQHDPPSLYLHTNRMCIGVQCWEISLVKIMCSVTAICHHCDHYLHPHYLQWLVSASSRCGFAVARFLQLIKM